MVFLSEQPPRTLTRPSVANMPQRFLLLGRAFNETVFLGLDRGPWFYSPTNINFKYEIYLYFVGQMTRGKF